MRWATASLSRPQTVQEQQNNEIKRLQEEISRLRSDHVHEMSQIKIQFQRDIQRQRIDEDSKVDDIRRQADRVRSPERRRETPLHSLLVDLSFRKQKNIFMSEP